MEIKKYLLFSILILVVLSSCSLLFDESLQLKKERIKKPPLKMDGYYYHEWGEPANRIILFFYQNGIVCRNTFFNIDSIDSYEKEIHYTYNDDNFIWKGGVFRITNDIIKYEFLYCAETCKAYFDEGKILNDTTFMITESYRLRKNGVKKKIRKEKMIFHFKQFSPKPDSTFFSFIK